MTTLTVSGDVQLESWVGFAARSSLKEFSNRWSYQTNRVYDRARLLRSDVPGRNAETQPVTVKTTQHISLFGNIMLTAGF